MIYIIYVALPMRKQTEIPHFHAKTTSAKLYICIGVGSTDFPCIVCFTAFFNDLSFQDAFQAKREVGGKMRLTPHIVDRIIFNYHIDSEWVGEN